MDNEKIKKPEKTCRKVGIFIKVNFINAFNKFKNDKEVQKKITEELAED